MAIFYPSARRFIGALPSSQLPLSAIPYFLMERLLLAPGPPLSRFVELLWYYHSDAQPHAKERLMPDGCISIVINLAEDQTRLYDPDDTRKMFTHDGCTLSGPHSKSFAIDTDEQNHVVGISFRPAGAVPFLQLPSAELCDLHLELADLWGPSARQLRDRVLEARAPLAKLRAVELALLHTLPVCWTSIPLSNTPSRRFSTLRRRPTSPK